MSSDLTKDPNRELVCFDSHESVFLVGGVMDSELDDIKVVVMVDKGLLLGL